MKTLIDLFSVVRQLQSAAIGRAQVWRGNQAHSLSSKSTISILTDEIVLQSLLTLIIETI